VARGVACTAGQVLVISSPREGVTAVVRQLLAHGDRVATEDPSHPSLPQLFSTLGTQVVGVPLDEQGFDVAALRRDADDARAVYLHPLAQYPLGRRTRLGRGNALLDWAAQHQSWIVEGHYNDEWVPRSEQTPTLFARDRAGRVLLLGTFEGVMFPSLRVAYLVLPSELANRFIAGHARLGERVPLATQWAVAQFIDSGAMTSHLQRVRSELAERREHVARRLAAVLPAEVRVGPLETGAQVCLHLPPNLPVPLADTAVVQALRKQRVLVEPLSPMTWRPGIVNGIVFGYMGWREADVLDAIDKIGALLTDMLAQPRRHQPCGENA
jgi:GntR family transcriptional regulator/MocR family aminotransferase